MFDFKEIGKSVLKVLAEAFLPFFGVIAGMVAGFDLDVSAGYQAAIAAGSAAAAGLAAVAGGLLGQLIDRARGVLKVGAEEAQLLADEIISKAEELREVL